jgi:hypothetical protein
VLVEARTTQPWQPVDLIDPRQLLVVLITPSDVCYTPSGYTGVLPTSGLLGRVWIVAQHFWQCKVSKSSADLVRQENPG